MFAALADPTRLRLLNLIKRGEICVCYLAYGGRPILKWYYRIDAEWLFQSTRR
jgi:DNA-binding transcriptional ArsR family regulator